MAALNVRPLSKKSIEPVFDGSFSRFSQKMEKWSYAILDLGSSIVSVKTAVSFVRAGRLFPLVILTRSAEVRAGNNRGALGCDRDS